MNFSHFTKTNYSKQPFLFLLTANAVFVVLAILLSPFHFEQPDDKLMAWTTSGYFSGVPDYHTLYMNVIYSWVESRLYMILPRVEWHTWMLILLHTISLTVIIYCISKKKYGKWVKTSLVLLMYVTEVYLLSHFQFTSTAGLIATAGLLFIVMRRKYWLGIVLFLLGSIVRFQAALFCGLITASFYPLIVLRQGFHRKQLYALCICVVGALSLHAFDKQIYYKDHKWKAIYQYDRLRGMVYDNSNTWRLIQALPNGKTREDLERWSGTYSDMSRWSTEDLQKCLSIIESQTSYHGIPGLKKIKNVPVQLCHFGLWFIILIPLLICGLISLRGWKERTALLIGMISLPVSLAMISLNIRLANHAIFCGWFAVLLLSTYLIPFNSKKSVSFFVVSVVVIGLFLITRIAVVHPSKGDSPLQLRPTRVVASALKAIPNISPKINCFHTKMFQKRQ